MDEQAALVKTQRDFCECFTETWLHACIPDSCAEVPPFRTIWAGRNVERNGNKKGGGIVLFLSEKWCNLRHVTLKERFWGPDIELLCVGMRL